MSVERKELERLHSLLLDQSEQNLTKTSDLDLLRTVVDSVRRSKELIEDLDESLAFDKQTIANLSNEKHLVQDRLWRPLDKFDDQLRRDFTCRRQMLLTRLDCTIESFKWKGSNNNEPKGGKTKSMNELIQNTYEKARLAMKDEPQVSMARLLSARQKDCDSLLNGVVSGARTADCKINYDRGGRTDEVRPPPKETFGQQRGRGGGRQSKHHGHRSSGDRRH